MTAINFLRNALGVAVICAAALGSSAHAGVLPGNYYVSDVGEQLWHPVARRHWIGIVPNHCQL